MIIGFKKIVERFKADDGLENKILDILYLQRLQEKCDAKMKKVCGELLVKTEMTSFSDLIVVSCNLKRKGNLDSLLSRVAYIVDSLFEKEIFCRGGAVIGNLHHDGQVVFGQALIDAHKLESEIATYPRIILTTEVVKRLRELSDIESKVKVDPKSPYYSAKDLAVINRIFTDFDGCMYLSPFPKLKGLNPDRFAGMKSYWLMQKRIIEKMLNKFNCDLKISIKYKWLALKFNEIVSGEFSKGEIERIKIE